MAVELYDLYKEIYTDYSVKLLTTSCFDKTIDWLHTIENDEFIYLLHGGELIFNSSLNFESEEVRKTYIDKCIEQNAGGLIVALEDEHPISSELISYCNEHQFPLLTTGWRTPFLEITRIFSAILLVNERKESNLIAALKNVIHSPWDEDLYLSCFERNLFFRDMNYTISVIGNLTDTTKLKALKSSIQHALKQSIIYEEKGRLILLSVDYPIHQLKTFFMNLKKREPDLLVGIGSVQNGYQKIYLSYQHAITTYDLIGKCYTDPVLIYDGLGAYQLLTDVSNPQVYLDFYQKTLGPLVKYDEENQTDYVFILECFFENECHLSNTSDALFFHKNTLKYKLAKIKEILGIDILSNQNRMNIMLALHIHKIGIEYYEKQHP